MMNSMISRLFTSFFFLLFLSACGGGGNNTQDTSEEENNSDVSLDYTGLRTDAEIDANLSRQVAEDYFGIEDFVKSMIFEDMYTFDRDEFQSGINATESCTGGGSVSLTTRNTGGLGISDIQFNNCTDDGTLLNGNIIFKVDFSTSILSITLNNLRFKVDSINYLMKGLIKYRNIQNFALVNILAEKANSEQMLIESLKLPIYSTNEDMNWDGTFFYSNIGKIKVDLEKPFSRYQTTEYGSVPTAGGPLIISDAINNKALFQVTGNNEDVLISFIPADSTISSQYGTIPWSQLGTNNIEGGGAKPIADDVFSDGENIYRVPVSDPTAENIGLNGSSSFDPDFSLLTYEWKIIEAPENSTATLSDANNVYAVLHPDYLGEYIIELTVSDGVSTSDPKQIKVQLGSGRKYTSFNPFTEYGLPTKEATQPGGEVISKGIFNGVVGLDVFLHAFKNNYRIPKYLKLKTHWEILQKPTDSQIFSPGDEILDWKFKPDVKGDYRFKITVNNGFEDFNISNIKISILDTTASIPIVYRITGDKIIKMNQAIELDIYQWVPAGPNINNSIVSTVTKPIGSSPQISVTGDKLNVKLDKLGKYEFSIISSNGIESSEKKNVIFYASNDTQAVPFELVQDSALTVDKKVFLGMNIISGDLNQDGITDLLMSWTDGDNSRLDYYQIFYREADNSYRKSPVYNNPYSKLSIIDFNNDGKNDLASVDGFHLQVVEIGENGAYTNTLLDTTIEDSGENVIYSPINIDINNDGLSDKAWFYNDNTAGFSYALQQSDFTFSTPVKINLPQVPKTMFAENNSLLFVYKNKTTDLVGTTPHIDVYHYSNAELTKQNTYQIEYPLSTHSNIFSFGNPKAIDLDNDGTKELVGEYFTQHSESVLAIWKKDSNDLSYKINQTIINGSKSSEFKFADMNADGDRELILFNHNGKKEVSVLYKNIHGTYDTADLIETNLNTINNSFYIHDFESDGDSDFFIHSYDSQEIKIIRNKLH